MKLMTAMPIEIRQDLVADVAFASDSHLQNHWLSYSYGPRPKSLLRSNPLTKGGGGGICRDYIPVCGVVNRGGGGGVFLTTCLFLLFIYKTIVTNILFYFA